MVAGQELRGLVEAGLVEPQGFGRWTSYRIFVSPKLPIKTEEDRILIYIQEHGSITNAQCRELLGVEQHQAYYLLKKLCDQGQMKPIGTGKGRHYVLK